MLTNSIKFKNFNQLNRFEKKIKQILQNLLSNEDETIKSLGKTYSNNYNIKKLKKFIGGSEIRLIGIGGSSLGAQSIYKFLGDKVKKKIFIF